MTIDYRPAISDLPIGDRPSLLIDLNARLGPRLANGERPAMITVLAITARRINVGFNNDIRGSIGDVAIADRADAGLGIGEPFRIYLSDGDWCGRPDDPGWQHINPDPRLISAPELEEQFPYGAEDQARGAIQNTGVELANADRYWDEWLKEFSAVGELAEIYLVEEGGRINDGFLAASFRVGNMVPAGNICRVEPDRTVSALEVPAQSTLFTGTGGSFGDDALRGLTQELTYGTCTGVPVNFVQQAKLRFKFHPGKIQGFTLLEDDQERILWDGVDHPTEAAFMDPSNDPAPGRYTKCTAIGEGRLGTSASGVLTANVQGAHIFGAFTEATGDILAGLARSVLPLDNINLGSFVSLPRAAVGIHIPRGSARTMADVFSAMLRPFAANYYEDANGRLAIQVGSPPGEADPLWAVTVDDLLDDDADAHPAPVRWQVQVSWGRQWRILTIGDLEDEILAGLVTPEQVDRATTEERWAVAANAEVKLRFRNALPQQANDADTLRVRGYFVYEEDALAAAIYLLAFYKQPLLRDSGEVPIGAGFGARGGRPGSLKGAGSTAERWRLDLDPQNVSLESVRFSPLAEVISA